MSKKAVQPTQEKLRQLFSYDAEKGVLVWIVGRRRGKPAGCLNGRNRRILSIDDIIHTHARLVWIWHNGAIPEGMTIDHINMNKSCDLIENLRLATYRQQRLNKPALKSKHGLPKGVTLLCGKYKAAIGTGVSGKSKHLGVFDTPEEAHAAYCRAAQEHFDPEFWRAS